jgi:hypothetical protein
MMRAIYERRQKAAMNKFGETFGLCYYLFEIFYETRFALHYNYHRKGFCSVRAEDESSCKKSQV